MDAIRRAGNQLAVEREPELQTLVGAAFVRLSQEAASKRCYPAMQQALASLETVEAQRPGSTQSLRPRIGAEERMPEFVEEALRSGQIADGMIDILTLMPKATLHYVTHRFGYCGFRDDCELLSEIVRGLGEDATQRLVETLQTAPASEAAETVGLLTLLAPDAVTKILPVRLSQWPRTSHDRTVMRGARPLRQAYRKDFGHRVRSQQGQQPDGFRRLGCGSRLESLDQALRGVFPKPAYNFAEQLAIIAKAAITETMSDVMQRSLGHQRQDIDHPVGYLPAAQRFFHKLRHAFFGANARTQTLRGAGTLRLHG